MKKRTPKLAKMPDINKIQREGEYACIEFSDPKRPKITLHIGPEIESMSDDDILLMHNRVITAMIRNRDEAPKWKAIEVPVGHPQLRHNPGFTNEWSPKGAVLRCILDSGDDDEPVIHIDDQEFTWAEFGKVVSAYIGWGMRIVFVPDDEIKDRPEISIEIPED